MRKIDSDGNDILKQGDTYEEVDLETGGTSTPREEVIEGSDTEGEPEEKSGKSFLGKIPKTYLLVGVIGVIILLLLVTVFIVMVSGNSKKSTPETSLDPQTGYILDEEGNVIEAPKFEYTSDEIEELRVAGYTGDEIEEFEEQELSVSKKVKESEEKRKKKYEEEIAPYLDSATEEFNWLKNQTWVGQQPLEYSKDSSQYTTHSVKQNFDYEKVPPYGNQLWIKLISVNTGNVLFMSTDPKSYNRLKDSGNIVIDMTYINTGEGSPNIIVGLKEVNVTGE